MASARDAFAKIKQQLKELHGAKVIVGVQGEPGKNFAGQTVSSSEELQKIATPCCNPLSLPHVPGGYMSARGCGS